MSYTKLYFNKQHSDLTYEVIENFFVTEKEESDKIEFKSYYNTEEKNDNEKEKGIIRTVCGLLNSEGGLIIWGAPQGQIIEGKKEKIYKGELSPSETLLEKDSFLSKITDLITPSPKGIKFQRLDKNGKYVYVIEVEKSAYSPHQFRNTYYMRIDGQTKPAPHYFIEALFRKITFPKLEGYIKIDQIRTDGKQFILKVSYFIFNKSKLQNEYDIYTRLFVDIGKFAEYGKYAGTYRNYTSEGHELSIANAKSTLYYNEPICETEVILIQPAELTRTNFECNLFLHFGGKQSPLMVSKYKLSLSNIYQENMNSLIINMEENIYSYDFSDKIDKTEAEKMKMILGR